MKRSIFGFAVGALLMAATSCTDAGGGQAGTSAMPGANMASGAQGVLNEGPFTSGQSTIAFYDIGSDPNTDVAALDIFNGLDGNIYYTTLGPISCNPGGFCSSTQGAFGQLNPVSKAFTEIPVSGAPQSVYMTPDGAVWGAINSLLLGTTGSLVRISPFTAGGMTQIPLPPETGASPEPRDVTYNTADLNVYFTDKYGQRVGKLPASGPYLTSSMTMYAVPNGPPPHTPGFKAHPHGITSAPSGNVFFADPSNGVVYKLTLGGALTGYVTPEQILLGPSSTSGTGYVRIAANGRIYVTQFGSGSFDSMTQSGAFTALPTAPSAYPYLMRTAFGVVVWDDLGNSAIGIYTLSSGALREIPVVPLVGTTTFHIPNGVVLTSPTSVWFACYGPPPAGKALCLGHLTLKSKWTVFPSTTLTLKTGMSPTNQLIGIAETGNSGPFTVTSADPSLVSVVAVANMDHNFVLRPAGTTTGTTTVTVLDAHGVSTPIAVTVK